jgi:hypothetical protein
LSCGRYFCANLFRSRPLVIELIKTAAACRFIEITERISAVLALPIPIPAKKATVASDQYVAQTSLFRQ